MKIDFGLLPSIATLFMLIFARVGSILMLMPGLGEQVIPVRLKLTLALAIALVFYPLVGNAYGTVPQTPAALGLLFGGELLLGLAIGFALRLLMATLQVAGSAIAMQLNLSFAEAVDPTQSQNSVLVANFLNVTGVALIFATDLHHMAIAGLLDSYKLFRPGTNLFVGDFGSMAVMTVAESFRVGLEIAAPFIVFGLVFQFGLGVLSRLMPQLQVYFVATPAAIAIGFVLLMLLTGAIFTLYLNHADTVFGRFLAH